MNAVQEHEIRALLADGERREALDRLLSVAERAPTDANILALIDQASPDHPYREDPPVGCLDFGYEGVRRQLPRELRQRGMILYALPEFRRCDSQLLPLVTPQLRFSTCQLDSMYLTTPARLSTTLPLHVPIAREPYFWQPPRVSMRSGVLVVRQSSRYLTPSGDNHYETAALCVYRIRGSLVHARYQRFGCWVGADGTVRG